jgi:hypothetical protein
MTHNLLSTHTERTIDLTEEQFDARFPLVPNFLVPDTSWGDQNGAGCMYGMTQLELDFIRDQHPQCIWTLVDGDDGDMYVLSGFHTENRFGHLVTHARVPEGMAFRVRIAVAVDVCIAA